MCEKGCYKVGEILFSDTEEEEEPEIDYPAYHEMTEPDEDGFCGHLNYALPFYCMKIGHLQCLRDLSKHPRWQFMYHDDIVICCVDHDQLDCLRFFLEEQQLPLTRDDLSNIKIGPKCQDYLEQWFARA